MASEPAADPGAANGSNGSAASNADTSTSAKDKLARLKAKLVSAKAARAQQDAKDTGYPMVASSSTASGSAAQHDAKTMDAVGTASSSTAPGSATKPFPPSPPPPPGRPVPVAKSQAAPAAKLPVVEVDNCFKLAFRGVSRKGKGKGKREADPVVDKDAAENADAVLNPAASPSPDVEEILETRIETPIETPEAGSAENSAEGEGEPASKRARIDGEAVDTSVPVASPSPEPETSPLPPASPAESQEPPTLATLAKLSVSKLKTLAKSRGVDLKGCLEKGDMVEALKKAGVGDSAAQEEPGSEASGGATVAKPTAKCQAQPAKPQKGLKAAWRNWKPAFAATPYVMEGSGMMGMPPGSPPEQQFGMQQNSFNPSVPSFQPPSMSPPLMRPPLMQPPSFRPSSFQPPSESQSAAFDKFQQFQEWKKFQSVAATFQQFLGQLSGQQ